MSTLTQQATAQIIPFARLAARMDKRDGLDRLRTAALRAERASPAIEWGSARYHDAAIAEERLAPHS